MFWLVSLILFGLPLLGLFCSSHGIVLCIENFCIILGLLPIINESSSIDQKILYTYNVEQILR